MIFKYSRYIFLAVLLLSGFWLQAQQPAFPGAAGYGRFASGGRGNGTSGRVVEVTNLEDDLENPPEGSLRWAFQQFIEELEDPILGKYKVKMPLTVVFRVGGVINLKGELRVNRNNMTIAGQTAPGDGICIRGATVNFGGSRNLIIRYLRFRPGDELGEETSALRIENGGNFIIDHCSTSWAIEEITHFSSSDNFTVQWCILSESLYNSIHKKGARGYAAQWGGQYASYHHNLLAHNRSRNPRINGSNENDIEALVDYRNNVNYNWGSSGAFYGGEWEGTPDCTGFSHVNVVNNYFIPGPATEGNLIAAPSTNRSGVPFCGYAKWFVNGNFMEGHEDITADNWLGIQSSHIAEIKTESEHMKSDGVLEDYDSYTQTAEDALRAVLESAGDILPVRDAIDRRIVEELRGEREIVRYRFITGDGTITPAKGVNSGIIDTPMNLVPEEQQDSVTAWDIYKTSTDVPADSDHDGIPDEWELANGLNPNDITDGRLIAQNGYSNLENYLNELAPVVSARKMIQNKNIRLFPNPAKDVFYIEADFNIDEVSVFDIRGNRVQTLKAKNNNRFDPGMLPAGIYVMKVISGDKQVIHAKLIKQ